MVFVIVFCTLYSVVWTYYGCRSILSFSLMCILIIIFCFEKILTYLSLILKRWALAWMVLACGSGVSFMILTSFKIYDLKFMTIACWL